MEHIDQNIFWEYIVGDLDTEHIEIIQQHIDLCPKCKLEYDKQLIFHKELYEHTDDNPSIGFSKRVIDQIEKDSQIEKAYQFWIKFAKISLVSAVFIAISLPVFMLLTQNIELTFNGPYIQKVLFQLTSICVVLWAFYVVDVYFRRAFVK